MISHISLRFFKDFWSFSTRIEPILTIISRHFDIFEVKWRFLIIFNKILWDFEGFFWRFCHVLWFFPIFRGFMKILMQISLIFFWFLRFFQRLFEIMKDFSKILWNKLILFHFLGIFEVLWRFFGIFSEDFQLNEDFWSFST